MDDDLLKRIAESYGTPTYVYDLSLIRRQASLLRTAFPAAGLFYALKANPASGVIRELARHGFGAEVITLGELERAIRAGVPPEGLLVGGPGQDLPMIERAVESGVALVSLDSRSQWETWRSLGSRHSRFLVRINPQLDPRTHPHLATGASSSKFGMPFGEALEVAAEVTEAGAFAGFHFHIGSQIDSVESYHELEAVAREAFSARPEGKVLDFGGGFAVPDFPLERFAAFANGLAAELGVELILEPGRFLVAEAGVLLTTVRHVKPGPVRHVIADAGMADLLRPALYEARHPVRRVGEAAGGGPADLDGPLCENADRLASGARLPVDLARGELLVVERTGAYGMAMASNYASSMRPAEVLVDGAEVRLGRARESVEDLWRLEEG